MSENFLNDVEFTRMHPVNPKKIRHSTVNPLDRVQHKHIDNFLNENAFEHMAIDNLLTKYTSANSANKPTPRDATFVNGLN